MSAITLSSSILKSCCTASRFVSNFFNLLTSCLLFYMLYAIVLLPLYRYFTRNMPLNPAGRGTGGNGPRPPRPWFGGFGGGGSGGGGGTPRRPPPPYTPSNSDEKPDLSSFTSEDSTTQSESWRPGFWSGLAAGAGGAALANNMRNRYTATAPPETQRPRMNVGFGAQPRTTLFGGGGGARRDDSWDRGEGTSGTSGLGSMRSSSGFGGSRNR